MSGHSLTSLDHVVGAGKEVRWDRQAERLGGLEIDDQLERRRPHHWQIGGLGTLEDLSGVNTELAIDTREARPIADQAAGRGVFTPLIDRRNGIACRQRYDLLAPVGEEWIGGDDKRAGLPLNEGGEGGVDLAF